MLLWSCRLAPTAGAPAAVGAVLEAGACCDAPAAEHDAVVVALAIAAAAAAAAGEGGVAMAGLELRVAVGAVVVEAWRMDRWC